MALTVTNEVRGTPLPIEEVQEKKAGSLFSRSRNYYVPWLLITVMIFYPHVMMNVRPKISRETLFYFTISLTAQTNFEEKIIGLEISVSRNELILSVK